MKSEHDFNLGDLVKDKVTGFEGVIVCIAEWLNGCVRVSVQPRKLDKDGKPKDTITFDVEQLTLVKARVASPSTRSGGPTPGISRNSDPRR